MNLRTTTWGLTAALLLSACGRSVDYECTFIYEYPDGSTDNGLYEADTISCSVDKTHGLQLLASGIAPECVDEGLADGAETALCVCEFDRTNTRCSGSTND